MFPCLFYNLFYSLVVTMASDEETPRRDTNYEDDELSNQSSKIEMELEKFRHDDHYNLTPGYGQV